MSLFPKKNNTRLSIKARLESEKSIADFATSSDDTYISILANNCNDFTIYNNSNAGVFGARGIVTENGTKYDTYIGIKKNNNIEKIAVFNEDTISLNKNTIITGDIIPSSNIVYNLGTPENRWKDLYLSGDTISLGGTKLKSSSETGSFVISDANNKPLALESGEMKIIGETGKNIIIKSKDNNLFANTVDAITGELIRELNVTEMNTDTMVEGSNLFYTSSRVANIINASNIYTCNYIENTSNKISNRITLQDKNLSNYITKTSNQIENRLTTTKNILEKNITNTSNEISKRITLLSTDQITEQFDANNRFIVDNKYIGDIEITGELRTSNLIVHGTTTTIETDKYTAEVLNINSLADYEQSALSVNKTGDQSAKTTIFSTTYNDQLVAYINTEGTLFASNLVGDGSKIRHVRLADNFTDELAEGNNNLYFTHGRVATIIDGSNVHTCNYIRNTSNVISTRITDTSNLIEGRLTDTSNKIEGRLTDTSNEIEGRLTDTSNAIEGRLTDTSNAIEGRLTTTSNLIEGRLTDTSNKIERRLTDTSNAIEGRLTTTSNLIEGRLTETSNEISTRITLLSTDQITEHPGANNRFIVNDKYIGDVYITGELRASNLLIDGTTTTIKTDTYTAEVLNIESIDNYEQSALSVNKTGDQSAKTTIFSTTYNDQLVAYINTDGTLFASNLVGDGSKIRHVRLADNTTDELAEGNNNLYFTDGRVATIIDSSNVHTCNYIRNTSNEISTRITDTSNAIEGRLTDTSNAIEKRITYTSNMIESRLATENNTFDLRLTETSNAIESRITLTDLTINNRIGSLTFDEIELGTSNKFIRNNIWNDNLYVAGKLIVAGLEIQELHEIYAKEGTGNIGNFQNYIKNQVTNNLKQNLGDIITNNINNASNISANYISANDISVNNLALSGDIIPTQNEVYDLGSAEFKFKDLYLSGNTINLGDTKISSSATDNSLSIKDSSGNLKAIQASEIELRDPSTNKKIRIKTNADNKISFVGVNDSGVEETVKSENDVWNTNDTNIQYQNVKVYSDQITITKDGIENNVATVNDIQDNSFWQRAYSSNIVYGDLIAYENSIKIADKLPVVPIIVDNGLNISKDQIIKYGEQNIYIFKNQGINSIKFPVQVNGATLIVGGGGAGGADIGGGGGAGNVIYGSNLQFPSNIVFNIDVGKGGEQPSESGEDSSAFGVIVKGGTGGTSSAMFPLVIKMVNSRKIAYNAYIDEFGKCWVLNHSSKSQDKYFYKQITQVSYDGVNIVDINFKITEISDFPAYAYAGGHPYFERSFAFINDLGELFIYGYESYIFGGNTFISIPRKITQYNFKWAKVFTTHKLGAFINEFGELFVYSSEYHYSPYLYNFNTGSRTGLQKISKVNINEVQTTIDFKVIDVSVVPKNIAFVTDTGDLYIGGNSGGGVFGQPTLYTEGSKYPFSKVTKAYWDGELRDINFKITSVSLGAPNNFGGRNYGGFINEFGELFTCGGSGQYNSQMQGNNQHYHETGHGTNDPIIYFTKVDQAYWDGALRTIDFKITQIQYSDQWYGTFLNEFGEVFSWGKPNEQRGWYGIADNTTSYPLKITKGTINGRNYINLPPMKSISRGTIGWNLLSLTEEIWAVGVDRGFYANAWNYQTGARLLLPAPENDFTNVFLPDIIYGNYDTLSFSLNTKILNTTGNVALINIENTEDDRILATWSNETKLFTFSVNKTSITLPNYDIIDTDVYILWTMVKTSANTAIWTVYINNVLAIEVDNVTFPLASYFVSRFIGKSNDIDTVPIEGAIYDVRVYNRTLSLYERNLLLQKVFDDVRTGGDVLYDTSIESDNILQITNDDSLNFMNYTGGKGGFTSSFLSNNIVSHYAGAGGGVLSDATDATDAEYSLYGDGIANSLFGGTYGIGGGGGSTLYSGYAGGQGIGEYSSDIGGSALPNTGNGGGGSKSGIYTSGKGGSGVVAVMWYDADYERTMVTCDTDIVSNKVVVSNNKGIAFSSVTDVELNYLSGTLSPIQAQLNNLSIIKESGTGIEKHAKYGNVNIYNDNITISSNKVLTEADINEISIIKESGTGIEKHATYGNINLYNDKITIDNMSKIPFQHPVIKTSDNTDISNTRDVIDATNYYQSFATPGNYSLSFVQDTVCDVLIVGGGGGSSSNSGGASAGGVLYATDITIPANTYSLTVGAGGISDGIIGSNGGFSEAFGARVVGGIASTSNFGASGFGENITGTLLSSFVNNEIAQNGGTKFETSGIVAPSEEIEALDNSDYIYYSFTESGTYDITFNKNTECDVLVVGAGGAGSSNYGGGSSGGLVYATGLNVSANTYSMTVGKGGIVDSSEEGGYSEVFGIRAVGGLPISSNLTLEQSSNIVSVENEFSGIITSNLVPSIDYGITNSNTIENTYTETIMNDTFLENSGTLGTSYNLTNYGAIQQTSNDITKGEYASLNKTYLQTNNNIDISQLNAVSVAFWMQLSGLNLNSDTVLINDVSPETFKIQRNGTTDYWSIECMGGVFTTDGILNDWVVDNTWNHYIFVFDNDNGSTRLNMYKNGASVFTSTNGTWSSTLIAKPILGHSEQDSSLIGNIDEVRLYDRVLTVDEVSELYNYVPSVEPTSSGTVITYNVVYDDLPNTWQEMETIATNNSGRLPTKTEMDDYVSGVNNGTITTKPHEQYASDAVQHSVWFAISDDGLSGYTTTIRPFYRITDNSGVLTGEVHNNGANPGTVNDGDNNIFKWVWYITESGTQNTSTPTMTGTYNTDSFLSPDDNEIYEYAQFTDDGTITFPQDTVCDILMVGGGGAGSGQHGGGGGAGKLILFQQVNLTTGTYTINIGEGGTCPDNAGVGSKGGDTEFKLGASLSIEAEGGGGAGRNDGSQNGGSGAGGDAYYSTHANGVANSYTAATINGINGTVLGNHGGNFSQTPGHGGGGGGAGTIGQTATGGADTGYGGDGGDGVYIVDGVNLDTTFNLSANSLGVDDGTGNYYLAGGGGGGTWGSGTPAGTGGKGGGGEGGRSTNEYPGANGANAIANTGSGGGGGSDWDGNKGGSGGSGLFVIRWKKHTDSVVTFGDTTENLLLWYNFNGKITTNVTQLLIGGSGINSSLISSTYGVDGTNGINIPITGDTNVYYGGGGSGYNITSNLSGTAGFGEIGRGGNGSLIPTNGNDGGIIIRVPKISNDPIIIFGGGGGTLQNGIYPDSITSIPNGGEGLSLPITGTLINYAGGGGGASTEINGDRLPSDATYGYGANSSLTSGFNGGDGIIIIKWRENDKVIPLKHKVITEGDLTGTGILKSSEVSIFDFSKILYRSNTITNEYFKTFDISIHSISTGALLFSGVIYRIYNVYKVPVSIDYTMMFSFYILNDISTTTDSISFKNSTIYFENNDVCRLSPDDDDMITISSK